eukprot:2233403-Prymnesium_polylepis.1
MRATLARAPACALRWRERRHVRAHARAAPAHSPLVAWARRGTPRRRRPTAHRAAAAATATARAAARTAAPRAPWSG